jgi:superfamily II DNA/RNA helicase
MESKEESKTAETQPKQAIEEGAELIKNKFTKNIASPFINHQKSWDDENHFKIPDDIRKNIEDGLGFSKPSNI